jgi:hypothetical protein
MDLEPAVDVGDRRDQDGRSSALFSVAGDLESVLVVRDLLRRQVEQFERARTEIPGETADLLGHLHGSHEVLLVGKVGVLRGTEDTDAIGHAPKDLGVSLAHILSFVDSLAEPFDWLLRIRGHDLNYLYGRAKIGFGSPRVTNQALYIHT